MKKSLIFITIPPLMFIKGGARAHTIACIKKIWNPILCVVFLLVINCCHSLPKMEEDNSVWETIQGARILTRAEANVEYMDHQYVEARGPLSIDEAKLLLKDGSLEATHHALCIYPEDMSQLHQLEADKSLLVFYHPFGYVLLPDPEEWITVDEEEELTMLLDEECCMLGEDNRDEQCEMFPIYVLWPVTSPILQELRYDYLYDVYLSSFADSINRTHPPFPELPHISGYLSSYDNRLGAQKSINNVQLEYIDDDGFTRFSNTDNDGYFYLINADASYPVTINLRNDKFTIRCDSTSNVKSLAIDINDYLSVNSNNDYGVYLSSNFYLDVYKAADYYFYGGNELLNQIPKYDTLGISIDIHAVNHTGPFRGMFDYSNTNSFDPYIYIWNPYNDYSGASSMIFGTVNHELGHATNYLAGAYYMYDTLHMIRESFASFVGWFNVLRYYGSYISYNGLGHNLESITTQGRQTWMGSIYDVYTPIYVDLFDGFNQNTWSSIYMNDPISGVPISFIISCSLGPQNFQNVYNYLLSGIGVYYTSSDFYTFFSPYNAFL